MKGLTKFAVLGLLALLILAVPAVASAQGFYFWAQVRDEMGNPITATSSCNVYTAGSNSPAQTYTSATLATGQGQPFDTDSLGRCTWYSAASTAVDLTVWNKLGRTTIASITQGDHSVVLDRQGSRKIIRIPFNGLSDGGSRTDTGIDIPAGMAVHDVLIEVTQGAHRAHIAVGISSGQTGGDDDGFCAGSTTIVGDAATKGKSISDAGWSRCHATMGTLTAGVGFDFYFTGFHSGALLSRGSIGNNTHTASSAILPHAGSYIRFPFIGNGTAKRVVYTVGGTAASTTVSGHIYLVVDDLGTIRP